MRTWRVMAFGLPRLVRAARLATLPFTPTCVPGALPGDVSAHPTLRLIAVPLFLLPLPQYLRSKSRAGVVALPPLMPQGIQRTMYLVPPSEEVCRQLGISWQVCSDCLLALIVPMALGR